MVETSKATAVRGRQLDYISVLDGFRLVAMTRDTQQLQSSKMKHKKDRKDSDDRKHNVRDLGAGEPVVTEVEGKKKKRKRKEEREGAIDGALSFSLVLQRADSDALYAHTLVDLTVTPSDEPDACQSSKATPYTEPEKNKRKKEKKRKKDAESDLSSMTESRKAKKRKRKQDDFSDPDHVAPGPSSPSASPKRPTRVTFSPTEAEGYLKTHNITVQLPPDIPALFPITSFDALSIPDSLRGTFSAFKKPTPIQACAWPPALSGRDVVGIAETGSGKTLAFGIPALARLLSSAGSVVRGKGPRALVLAPTRELALQTYDVLSALDVVQCVAVFGGVDKTQQVRVLNKGAQVVVGTPGRVLDLIRDGVLSLGGVEYLVLDEADRMLDKGFENDIRSIIGYAKQGAARQTLMCTSVSCVPASLLTWSIVSATWPEAVRRLATSFLREPVRITVGSEDLTANSRVAQGVLPVRNVGLSAAHIEPPEIEVFDDEREKEYVYEFLETRT